MLSYLPLAEIDFPAVQRLADHIWRSTFDAFLSTEQIDYMLPMMYASDVMANEIADGYEYFLIAIDADESPAGYIEIKNFPERLYLSKLYLLPAIHGKGYGRAALDWVANAAAERGLPEIALHVNKGNARAIRTYTRAGYEIAGEREKAIGSGFVMNDYEMRKRIDDTRRIR